MSTKMFYIFKKAVHERTAFVYMRFVNKVLSRNAEVSDNAHVLHAVRTGVRGQRG